MTSRTTPPVIAIVGAGIGGLAAALRLAHAGARVTVFEAQPTPGGKMRTIPSAAGPIDAGPTVLTMRSVFDDLFAAAGLQLDDYLTLTPLDTLARHYWPDGTMLDLMADPDDSLDQVTDVFGPRAADEVRGFSARAARLFDAFEAPMMKTASPGLAAMAGRVMRQPGLALDMAPHLSLAGLVQRSFGDPRLAQLFARYATYVGGAPQQSPALLSLIWAAEARGVWTVTGGMHQLAVTLARLAQEAGARFHYNTPVHRLAAQGGRVARLEYTGGTLDVDAVLFNGDPQAIAQGLLGAAPRPTVRPDSIRPRSLSAHVASFAATPRGLPLAHHTVFFADTPNAEFDEIAKGRTPVDATLYLCAQDHGHVAADALHRFEIIRNAPPLPTDKKEDDQCKTMMFDRMRQFGLTFSPGPVTITGPQEFATLFPASDGALYGRSPQGTMAAFKRPTARTTLPGLYLCGGGAHPGAGVPMAALSGQHAAEAMKHDLSLT
ncbi:FAD-dependent oxidoreductase [Loktanella sp. TSTF-M6]|uniref:FAD-dependent oxidoreductase n=1 Tax=Loktanella gaetbuli TaxID=2881335 RepID=A0ABS8BUT8_9RHOB|nr:1-hydroxycarotenoid 3,4-desaturase CrtD [Loktanella gaetbuli]MCB5199432.1 FAD-dependent oxidoreductase [Loktanella gaetbuli]